VRAVVQRVARASVTVARETVGRIGAGLLVYAAAHADDGDPDIAYIATKIAHLRVFPDQAGKMNLDVRQSGGGVLLVSAFTVHADARKGRRPSCDASAPGPIARPLIEQLGRLIRDHDLRVETGRFAEHMLVDSVNDGPICILLDSRRVV
jgi:D-tyrosyl-tRNA(Tyr) deacylase